MTKQRIKKLIVKIGIVCIVISIATFMFQKEIIFFSGRIMTNSLSRMRDSLYGDVPESKKLLVSFGQQIAHEIRFGVKDGDTTVQDYLDAGCNPNYCMMLRDSWNCRNPLMIFNTSSIYVTYDEKNPTYPDVKVFNELVRAGADINKYPYVWAAVYCHDDYSIDNFKKDFKEGRISEETLNHNILCELNDYNRVLKLFLDAGAEVNRKGSPLPFDFEKSATLSENEVQNYFNSPDATTPIYEAIKKGSLWESQVDLLLEYGATVDKSCLEAAKLSGDEKMIEKVKNLLNRLKE